MDELSVVVDLPRQVCRLALGRALQRDLGADEFVPTLVALAVAAFATRLAECVVADSLHRQSGEGLDKLIVAGRQTRLEVAIVHIAAGHPVRSAHLLQPALALDGESEE